jgi:hypothetical protein
MKLFHYTNPRNYLRIAASGITPHASDENAYMTGGVPVVWLTQQASNVATAEYLALMVKSYGEVMAKRKVGELMFGGTARLTVNLPRHDKRLVRYLDFLREPDMAAIREGLLPEALRSWWVYLGTIPPRRIEPVPAALMFECLSWHIETDPDVEARKRFRADRERLAACPPDALVEFFVQ